MALSTERASGSQPSSAESSATRRKYDVFLSFRGVDTRRTVVSFLYHELINREIITFKDDTELEAGEPISPSLLIAIKESWLAIVVLSPNYVSSKWCLDELKMIVEYMEDKNMIVLPIFYDVDPSDVRYQKASFAVALTSHEETFGVEVVNQWRAALTKVANLSGLESKKYGSDQELVKHIVETVWSKVRPIDIEWAMCSEDFVAFEATKQAMDQIVRALQHDEVTTIGVFGMGGVGKTSMVKHVSAEVRKIGLFNRVIMAVISQTPNLKNIQGTLADLLGLKLVEETDVGRGTRILKEILRGYKILIILDDIWERIDLSTVGIPNHTELQKRGSKIIFTTRRFNVCHTMESQASIPLRVLSEDDAWDLFVKKSRNCFYGSVNFYDVARAVAKECAGLPVALLAVARALGDKDLEDWMEAAKRLKVAQPANYDDERDVFRSIKLSYDYLRPDDHNIAKSFFLLCCLFPEDYDIAVEDLMVYAIGIGLFQDARIKEARAKSHSVVKYLKASSLLLDGANLGYVKMHDVIRDVAISISLLEDGSRYLVRAGCDLCDWPAINLSHEGYSAISLMRNQIQELPKKLVCSKLQILLLQRNAHLNKIPNPFFQSSNELRVFDLRQTSILLLPSSFKQLNNLQALYLDDCKRIVDISLVGKLKNLLILSMKNLRGIRKKELPKEIAGLTKLKILDVTNACFETVPFQLISKLEKLEELYMKCDFCDWGTVHNLTRIAQEGSWIALGFWIAQVFWIALGFGIGMKAHFTEVTSLPNLTSLTVNISDVKALPDFSQSNWVNFNICICGKDFMNQSYYGRFFERKLTVKLDPHPHIFRYVTLNTNMNSLPHWFIQSVIKKAEILEYIGYSGLENILEEYHRGELHVLKCLAVIECNVDVLMNSSTRFYTIAGFQSKAAFESLIDLYLEGVKGLQKLCVGELPAGSLCNLKLLNVRNCPHLVNALLPSNLLIRLENLEILHCEYTEDAGGTKLEYVFGFEELEREQVVLPKLREMTLCFLNLTRICNGPAPTGIFRNLHILAIRGCHLLNYLFEHGAAECLSQLELLWVEDCSVLGSVFPLTLKQEIMVVLPKLKDIYLSRLPQFVGFFTSLNQEAIIQLQCPSLEHLYVFKCPKLSNFAASDFHSRNRVQANDEGHFAVTFERLFHRQFNPEEIPQFFSKKESDFSIRS